MEQRVSISISDGIADVRLVRADKMNALDAAMFEALVAATERLAHEKGVRVVVLSGEGRAFCAGLDMGRFAAMKESGGNGIAGGEKRDLTARTHGLANFPQAGGLGLAAASGAGHRRDPGRGLRRRVPARARRRHALPHARRADVDHGDQMGPGARHGRHADPRKPRPRRYLARPHLHRPHLLRAGSHELWSRDADLRRSACCGLRGRARNRRQESRCDPRRQAHAEQVVRRSRLRRCSPNPSSSRNCSAAPTRPKPCAPIWKSARRGLRRRGNHVPVMAGLVPAIHVLR